MDDPEIGTDEKIAQARSAFAAMGWQTPRHSVIRKRAIAVVEIQQIASVPLHDIKVLPAVVVEVADGAASGVVRLRIAG